MALEVKEDDDEIFNQPMIRSGQDKQSAWPQESGKFAKDKLGIINMLDHFRRENGVEAGVRERNWLIWSDQLELDLRKSGAVAFDDRVGDIHCLNLIALTLKKV